MYAGTAPRSFGFVPIAVIGMFPVADWRLVWFLFATSLPLVATLIVAAALLRQDLTEAEAMVVEDRRNTEP